MDELEQAQKIIRSLCAKYKTDSETVTEATYQAYSDILEKNPDVEEFGAYWYVASKYRLLSIFRRRTKEKLMEDWEVPSVHPEEEDDQLTDQRDFFTEIHDILYDRLSEEEYKSFKNMRAGVPVSVEAELEDVSRETIYRRRKDMVNECRMILSEIYTDHEFYDWKPVTQTEPHINTTVLVRLEKGIEGEAFRIKPDIWIWENGRRMMESPVEWKEC